MTNNDQFKDWISQIDQADSSSIDGLIEHKVKQLRRNKHIRWISVPISSLVSLVLAFALLVNMNDAFYVYALNNPILKPLTQLVNGRQDILSAFDSGYVQVIDQTITVDDYSLEVDSIISDTRSINVFYKIRVQGKLIENYKGHESIDLNFLSLSGESISYGISYHHFENYWWAEISLKDLNAYKPFIIKFTPDHDVEQQFGELQVNIDQTKVIQPVTVPIDETIVVGGQKLIIKSLEMGAFSSQLTYYPDPHNDKLVVLVMFENFTSGVSWDDDSLPINYKYENFPFGQLNHEKTFSLKLKNASLLDRTFETITFDPKTRNFNTLPPHLSLKEVVVDENEYEIILEETQSVGNQGLMPIMSDSIEDPTGSSETTMLNNQQVHHIKFVLKNDQIIIFNVIGGTELRELPEPLIIALP